MINVLWWDHTLPFPENQKTGCPDLDKDHADTWYGGPQLLAEQLRAAEAIRFAQTGERNDVMIVRRVLLPLPPSAQPNVEAPQNRVWLSPILHECLAD